MTCSLCAGQTANNSTTQGSTTKTTIEAKYIGSALVDNIDSLPDYLLAERDIEDPATGNVKRVLFRVPTFKIIPNGNFDNIVAVSGSGSTISVQEGQVVAAKVQNEATGPVVVTASGTDALFLVVGALSDGQLLIQNCGVVNFPEGHNYIVGLQYWAGANGEPTTSSTSGKKLFYPISSTKLLVNIN